jgi:D-glucosaminate-6-phosphate ammonia-lyase
MSILNQFGVRPVINAMGTSTIVGASPAVAVAADAAREALTLNFEIDELQRAASNSIARATSTEAACVTSSASSGLAICSAACMTGSDLAAIARLPETAGLRNEIVLQSAHDINFGGRVSQMVRLSGASAVLIGSTNHCASFHLRGALSEKTAALLFVVNGAVNRDADLLTLERCVELCGDVPVIVDAAAEPDVRPFYERGAALVITSGQKAMGAPTSGLICGKKNLVRACYLQNWGIGRAMKVGKEGIAGMIAAVERWYRRDPHEHDERYAAIAALLKRTLQVRETDRPYRLAIDLPGDARKVANLLREGEPAIWVNDAAGRTLVLDLRAVRIEDAAVIAHAIANATGEPREDVPFHDLYYSEERLLRWPD